MLRYIRDATGAPISDGMAPLSFATQCTAAVTLWNDGT